MFLGCTHRPRIHHWGLLSSWSLCLDDHTAANLWLLQGESPSGRLLTVLGQISLRRVSCPNLLSEWAVLYQTKAPTSWRASNYCSPAVQHGRMHFVNHQLVPARGGPPGTFITLDRRLSLFEQPKPLLNLCMAHFFIPRSLLNHIIYIGYWAWVPMFLAKLDADVLLNFLGHCQCTTHNWFWLTEQSGLETVIHEWAWRSKVTCTALPAPSAFLFERKNIWSDTVWSGHVHFSPVWKWYLEI